MAMLKRTETKLFLTVFLVYGFYVTMTDPFNNIDALCVAMVDRGTFEIDQRVMHDYALLDGKKYSGYSPGASWLLTPYYCLLKPLCRLAPKDLKFQAFSVLAAWLLTIPLAALCVAALYRLLREWELSERVATVTALGFAFGTMWFPYARRHNSYALISAALIFLAFVQLNRLKLSISRKPLQQVDRSRLSRSEALVFLVSGFLALTAVVVDYKNIVSVIWICLYVLLVSRVWQSCFWFGLGALPPLIAMFGYNWIVFGHPLYTPAKFEVANNKLEQSLQPGTIPLEGALHFDVSKFVKLLVGPYTGFFLYMPLALLALFGIAHYLRNRPLAARGTLMVTTGIFLSNLMLSASLSSYWHAGGDRTYYGPAVRYLLPAVPFAMLFAGVAIQRVRPSVTCFFVVISAAINWMFVLSANYGGGASPMQPGLQNLPLVIHAKHILETRGAESAWFSFLASSHFPLGKNGAAAITWCGAAMVGMLVWLLWRPQRS
jgi:hypothetical protein